MSVALGPTSCPSAHALKSKFLRMSEAQYDLVPRFSHHSCIIANSNPLKGKSIAFVI